MSLGEPFRILSFEGPFKGSAADVTIFRETIKPLLLPGEMVMTDKGYWQDDRCWTPPVGNYAEFSEEMRVQRRRVTIIRHLNERGIGRLKFWGVMSRRWAGLFSDHQRAANVVAKLTQLELYTNPLT